MKMKKIIGVTLVGSMVFTSAIALADYNPNKIVTGPITTTSIETTKKPLDSYGGLHFVLVVNEKGINPQDAKVYMSENDTVMIPLRAVSEALGYEVKWNNEASTVELTKDAQWITVKTGEDNYTFGKMAPIKLGTASEIKEDRTYVPLNFIKDILKLDAFMDETGVINITSKEISSEVESIFGIEGKIIKINNTEKSTMVHIEGKRFGEGYNDSIILKINENTKLINPVTDEKLSMEDLKEGDVVRGFYGPAVTRSLPSQGNAEKIEVLKDVAVKSGTITEVIKNEKYTQILVGDRMSGIILTINDETKILTENNKKLTIEDLKKGLEIEAYHDLVMTMSLPPISSARKIVVKENK